MTAQSREDLIAMAIRVLRGIRDTEPLIERIAGHVPSVHYQLAMRFRLEHGISIVTGAVDAIVPEDGWLVRFDVPPDRLQGDPSRVTELAVLLVDAAIEALEARRAKEPR